MTKEQIIYLRKNYCANNGKGGTVANSVFYIHDNMVVFRDHNDFVIFDDEHELIHCIAANSHTPIKNECPFSVNSTGYEMLQFVEANLTFDGLMMLLEKMFSSIAKPQQIELVKNWAKHLPASIKNVDSNIGDYWMDKAPEIPRSTVNSSWVRDPKENEEEPPEEAEETESAPEEE